MSNGNFKSHHSPISAVELQLAYQCMPRSQRAAIDALRTNTPITEFTYVRSTIYKSITQNNYKIMFDRNFSFVFMSACK